MGFRSLQLIVYRCYRFVNWRENARHA